MLKIRKISVAFVLIIVLFSCKNREPFEMESHRDWSDYLGGPERNHYSELTQIHPDNVKNLRVAWTHKLPDSGQMQMNPLIKDKILYGVSPSLQAFALDAATGKELWRFGDPFKVWYGTSRGVSFWTNGKEKRIFFVSGAHLYALNALTGKPILSFGDEGKLDLHTGLPEVAQNKFISSTTPGTIYKNLIIMPVRVSEGSDAAPGDVRAFDVVSGKLVWTFHTMPHPGEAGYESWENKKAYLNKSGIGAANNWAGMAVDTLSGTLFVPLGSAAPDFYGGQRLGNLLYASSLVALDAETGKLKWYFQFTHHDIWDRDLPAPPNLITVTHQGKHIKAVAQITKQGYVFVFDRETGKPLFDIEERNVPKSTLAGEVTSETQPFPVKPKPFARQSDALTASDLSPYAENKAELLEVFKNADRTVYAPPALDPVLLLPGYDGGAEWGGAAADPDDGILYVNSNEMAWFLQMEKAKEFDSFASLGEKGYQTHCASCHQPDLSGNSVSGFPSLVNIGSRLKKSEVLNTVNNGKGKMVGFSHLSSDMKNAIISYIFGDEKNEIIEQEIKRDSLAPPYTHKGYQKFLDSNGLPAISPPWGTLHAINLNTGDYIWSIPLGDTPSLKSKGYPQTGTENYGGPVVTKSGLLIIAATKDGFIRIFNKHTGELLWAYELPAASFATPSTYMIDGKQYIVLACGGEKLGTPKGNVIMAFALE
jgi:quinoprotein glucose dehydrogenase